MTRVTIVFFVVAGILGTLSVAIFLLGPQLFESLGTGTPRTISVVVASVLAVASAWLVYRGVMRAAVDQDTLVEREERNRSDWEHRRTPGPPRLRP